MQIQFFPKAVQEKKLTGYVSVKVPTLDERLEYMENAAFDMSSDNGEIAQNTKNISILRKLLPVLKEKHLVEVALADLDGNEFKSYDDLQYSEAGSEVLMECAGMLLNGFKPAKN